jgi:catecholate siderophore receptor
MYSSHQNKKGAVARRLLAWTSLSVAGFVLVPQAEAQTELPAVQIQGNQTGSYTSQTPGLGKLTEPLADTPVSVTTVTKQVMDDRGETTLGDVLRNAPGITLGAGEFNWQGDDPYIRGFSARSDMFLDGLRDFGDYYRDPFDMEKVEVLEGPDSILFGRGSTGGVINQVTKTPQLDELANASVSLGTDNTKRVVVDYNTPIDGLDTPAAFRIDGMAHDSGVAGRDEVDNKRYGIAPSLALGLGTPTRIDVSYFHQQEDDQPDYGIPWYFGKPAPVPRNTYYGYKGSDYLKNDVDIVTGKAEQDFDDFTVREQLRYADYTRSERISKAMEPAGLTTATPLSAINVNVNSYTGSSRETELENQTDFLAKVDTGAVTHDLVAGLEFDDETSDPTYINSTAQQKSLLTPNKALLFNPAQTYLRSKAQTHTSTYGVYAMDTLKLGEQWQLLAGVRFDSFAAGFNDLTYSVPPAAIDVVTSVNNQHRVDQMPSYRGALVYKPVQNGTFYFSYGTSFDPSAEGLNFINSGENYNVSNEFLSPEKNRNFELGTKWQLLDQQLFLTGALFRSEKYNARLPDPANPGFDILGGDERVDGFELQAQGQITPDWNVTAGYDYLNSDTIKTAVGGPPLGFALPFTPRDNATFWSSYRILPDLQIGAGGQYVSARYAQTTAPIEQAPGYITFDAMAKYLLTDRFDLQLNVYNVTDKYYYDTLHPAFVIPGAGRSAMMTLNFHY